MAASTTGGFIRLRLLFDYPPPTAAGCRMCWLLVDMSACRVVADVESEIREKFGFSRRSIFHLYLEDCYLPHTESVLVVRDNDSVRVKVECASQVNGLGTDPEMSNGKKRCRDSAADGQENDRLESKTKKRKKKKKSGERKLLETPKQVLVNNQKTEAKKKKAKPDPQPELQVKVSPQSKKTNKPQSIQTKSQKPPLSDSSSSEEDTAPKKTTSSTLTAPKSATTKPAAAAQKENSVKKSPQIKKNQETQAKSQKPSDSSSSDEDTEPKKTSSSTPYAPKAGSSCKPTQKNPVPSSPKDLNMTQKSSGVVGLSCNNSNEHRDSDQEEEIQLVIRRPLQPPAGLWRGRGRFGGPSEYRRSIEGQRGFRFSGDVDKEPSYSTDTLTNKSKVLQYGEEVVPKRDYNTLPLLAAPPAVGQKIAFKLLELTENYTPEVSEYKEGKIVSFDTTSKQIELELLSSSQAPVEPGKFDLVYQNPDGTERVEYAVSRESWVTERWESLLEPRLII